MENVSRKKIWIAHGLIDPANFFEHVLVEPKNWDVAFQAGKTKKESYLLRLVWSFFISFFGHIISYYFKKITTVTRSTLDALTLVLVLCMERSSYIHRM